MAQHATQLTGVRLGTLIRSHLYLAFFVAAGLLAIGASGAVCQALGWQFGDHVLAADSQSAHLSAARCADLQEYHAKPTCAAAEMAHHADEVVRNRLAAGVLGVVALAATGALGWLLRLDADERRRNVQRYLVLATAAFGIAAAVLLCTALGVALRSGDGLAHWLADGGVAAAMCVAHALAMQGSARTLED